MDKFNLDEFGKKVDNKINNEMGKKIDKQELNKNNSRINKKVTLNKLVINCHLD